MNHKSTTSPQIKSQHQIVAKELSKDLLHQKFIEAALSLDVSILEPFIPEDMQLQDLDKYRFLDNLNDLFESIWHQHPEDWRVELADNTCLFCNVGKPLASFAVYTGCEYMPFAKFGYFVETNNNGETKDIYICKSFMKTLDFKNHSKTSP